MTIRATMALIGVLIPLWASAKPVIMPLNEVQPGMVGEWRTVIKGVTIESFELVVLGVAENFIGPKRAVIICEATDARNKLIGPVAGMSGSPVTIDGKLIGAYAYGFDWSKDQAVIGVTPIEQMLEVLEQYPFIDQQSAVAEVATVTRNNTDSQLADNWRVTRGSERLSEQAMPSMIKPPKTPLFVSGMSRQVLEAFSKKLKEQGLELFQAPMGGARSDASFTLEPGAPVAGVLMSGDFSIAGTGTVTYRDDDTLLAFGHPFLQSGLAQIPMAGAEVITVVQRVSTSFKLTNTGPVVGSIYQDRLPAIAGRIGSLAPTSAVTIRTRSAQGKVNEFSGQLFQHPRLSPLFAAMALLQALNSTLESSEEQTLYIDSSVEIDGFKPIVFRDAVSGPAAGYQVASDFEQSLRRILDNPFKKAQLKSVDFSIELKDQWLASGLKTVHIENHRVRPGETLDLSITLMNYRQDPTHHRIAIPVPDNVAPGETLSVALVDASHADKMEGITSNKVDSLSDLVEQWRRKRSRRAVYIMLVRKAAGLRMAGENLRDLPPSVEALYTAPGNHTVREILDEVTLWETRIETPGEFQGFYRLPVTLE